jgi:hypothetical protein
LDLSKIVDFAIAVEKELTDLQDKNAWLLYELDKAKKKNEQVVNLMCDFLTQVQEVMKDE